MKSDVRNLGCYLAEREDLVEGYRAFAVTAILPMPAVREILPEAPQSRLYLS
ncbi:MAG TPA: hypothetical protein VFV38_30890 [Ktedonobacteraceae bacterium]|nr:hypothetical protein [Ktedonobacteraceae bacterium]